MKARKTGLPELVCLAACLVLFWAGAGWAGQASAVQTMAYNLTSPQVVDQGKVTQTGQGSLLTGYTVTAQASGKDSEDIKKGVFQIKLTAFKPSMDMPGQKAGLWYVRGEWTLQKGSRAAEIERSRSLPAAVLRGELQAVADYDFTAQSGDLKASVSIPRARQGAAWIWGEGAFQGTSDFKGLLSLNMTRQTLPGGN